MFTLSCFIKLENADMSAGFNSSKWTHVPIPLFRATLLSQTYLNHGKMIYLREDRSTHQNSIPKMLGVSRIICSPGSQNELTLLEMQLIPS